MNLPNELRQYAEDIFSVTGPNPRATVMNLAADEIEKLQAHVSKSREAKNQEFLNMKAERDAAVWLEAAELVAAQSQEMSCQLAAKADALLKGLEKEHG